MTWTSCAKKNVNSSCSWINSGILARAASPGPSPSEIRFRAATAGFGRRMRVRTVNCTAAYSWLMKGFPPSTRDLGTSRAQMASRSGLPARGTLKPGGVVPVSEFCVSVVVDPKADDRPAILERAYESPLHAAARIVALKNRCRDAVTP